MSHLRKNHSSAASSPAGAAGQKDLFFYFLHLEKRFFQSENNDANFKIFQDNWQLLNAFKFDSKERSNILHKCAKTLVKSGEMTPIKQDLVKHIQQNFSCWSENTFFALNPNAQEMANTLWAMATLRVLPGDEFLNAFEQRFFSQNPDAQNMANTIWAMATLGVVPGDDFLRQFEWRFFSQNPNAQNMANTIWAMAVLDVIAKGKIKPIAERLFKQMGPPDLIKQFKPVELSQIKQAAFWFDWDFNVALMPETKSLSVSKEKLTGIFTRTEHQPLPTNNPAGQCDKLKHRVDIPLPRIGQKPVWMEYDGPSHFIIKSNGSAQLYDGNTILNTALLLKFAAGALVLRMPTAVGKMLLNLPDQKAIQEAQFLITRIKQFPPDKAYAVVLRDNGEDLDIVPFEPHLQVG